jgi:hypothetical protein
MFSCDNPNIIISDEGFSVQVLGPSGLRYVQGDRFIRISSEALAHPYGLVIYTSSIRKWEEPYNQPVEERERGIIIENIRRAFAFRNIEIEVI